MVDAIMCHVYDHPVRVVTVKPDRTHADLIDANGRYGIAETILAALADAGYRIVHQDELRARDERIIEAALTWAAELGFIPNSESVDHAAIIAAAEAE